MAKTFTHTYTPEKLHVLERGKLLTIRENALRHGVSELVQMCDDELNRRAPAKSRKQQKSHNRSDGDTVVGYHFVCSRDRGVADDGKGQFRSGSWVVAESNVIQSLKYGAYLALHETKNDPSYRQGRVIGYSLTPRDMIEKDNVGIEFLVEETDASYEWVGDGAGEKGYKWKSLVQPAEGEKL